ncbi:hypothetical protein E1B28_002139 [Marasmius oreades]|uniref:Uncharacterized protein n=1 Tax=Marasmius oreades TaxID=181124 RepID=A0A9P7RN23_9AGAR|nr:uncharacterized protein E1B28_002139 [Marasmius oreades]KAG7086181.1 hypothetical protein E1B28_002139 [Marasmius oreades]
MASDPLIASFPVFYPDCCSFSPTVPSTPMPIMLQCPNAHLADAVSRTIIHKKRNRDSLPALIHIFPTRLVVTSSLPGFLVQGQLESTSTDGIFISFLPPPWALPVYSPYSFHVSPASGSRAAPQINFSIPKIPPSTCRWNLRVT